MKSYKLIVHRPAVLYEVWYAEAASMDEAREMFNNGDAEFQWQDNQESDDPVIQSVEALPGPDPDIDIDEGL